MVKPSTEIMQIVKAAPKDAAGNAILSPTATKQILSLARRTDKRDQQLRKPRKAR